MKKGKRVRKKEGTFSIEGKRESARERREGERKKSSSGG